MIALLTSCPTFKSGRYLALGKDILFYREPMERRADFAGAGFDILTQSVQP